MNICPICGYDKLRQPPDNCSICPVCQTEFGISDSSWTQSELRQAFLSDVIELRSELDKAKQKIEDLESGTAYRDLLYKYYNKKHENRQRAKAMRKVAEWARQEHYDFISGVIWRYLDEFGIPKIAKQTKEYTQYYSLIERLKLAGEQIKKRNNQ